MAHSYVVSLHHCVFSTARRFPFLTPEIRPQLFAYIGGIASNHKVKLLAANGVADHTHLLVGLPQTMSIAKCMQLLKGNSSKWLHDTMRPKHHGLQGFEWQEGYGAFSIGVSQTAATLRYIAGQEEHHRKVTFEQEYQKFLVKHGIQWLPDEALG